MAEINRSLSQGLDLWKEERIQRARGLLSVCGIDEAGRGPLAGPVVAACVQLPFECELPGVFDSKALKPDERDQAFQSITDTAISIGIGIVEPSRIDALNILRATHQAMREAFAGLSFPADVALIDGLPVHPFPCLQKAIVKGDAKSISIAAASIIAKVTRDRIMDELHEKYPEFRFDLHKGYPTALHFEQLNKYGPCPEHRRSFAPVARLVSDFVPEAEVDQLSLNFDTTIQKIGEVGEQVACDYLKQRGFQILDRRFRCPGGEIDIIANRGTEYRFIEVKTRSSSNESPSVAVDAKKRARMAIAADSWLYKNDIQDIPCQFDIVEVIKRPDAPAIVHHIEGAFFAGE